VMKGRHKEVKKAPERNGMHIDAPNGATTA
jgi:hypothetical protein